MAGMRNHGRHTVHALALAAFLTAGLTACAGGDEGTGGSAGAGAGDGRDRAKLEKAALEHAECMRREGVDVPDPKPGQGGIVLRGPREGGDPAMERRAARTCERHLRDVPPPRLTEEQKTELRDGALRHARCMRARGIPFPDPKFDGNGGVSVKFGDGFDPADPRVREAERSCRRLLPRPGGRPNG